MIHQTASERLVEHALQLRWEQLPVAAQHMARTFLHDSLAVGVAGSRAPHADDLAEAASGWGRAGAGDAACSILARPGMHLPPPQAAFVNAFQIHNQEYDAVHEPAVVHPMATIVAVLLAAAERSAPVSGAAFLTALCAGVDVAVALGVAATTPLKFFRPATAGIFGCVAALANLERLDRATAVKAMGLALAFAGGTMQAHKEGLPTLPLQIAAAAQGAIQAIDLAKAGVPGPIGSIDGPFGYLALFEDGSDIERALADLAERRRIVEVSWKPFPTGRAAHGAIVATQRLMAEQGLMAQDIVSLVYRAPPLISRLVGRRPHADMAPAYARLCFAYLGAVVLRRGTVGLEDFSAERLHDPETLALAERIAVVDDGTVDPAAFVPAFARADLRDGRSIEVRIDAQFGSPEDPLSEAQHQAKAAACLAYGGLGDRADALASLMARFADVPDAGAAINAALHPPTR